MYSDTSQDAKIYSTFVQDQPEESVVSSLAEQSQNSRSQIQNRWNAQIAAVISQIADENPYLPDLEPGQEMPAVEAARFVQGTRGVDCRPRLFDGISRSWKLCDTGSMLTVIKKTENDVLDKSKVLQAVNGTSIKVYGQKEVEIRLGRKSYPIMATIADVQQDILGWDFIAKHKLDMIWSETGLDLYLFDRKAKIKQPLKFYTLPAGLVPQTSVLLDVGRHHGNVPPEVAAFQVASMKALKTEEPEAKHPAKYQIA